MPAARRVLLFLLFLLVLRLFPAVPSASSAQNTTAGSSPPADAGFLAFGDAARQLAAKIAATLPPHEAIAMEVRNLSSLNAAEVAAARRALEAELQARGLRLDGSAGDRIPIRVTLSENQEGYLWVGEVARPDTPQVVMVSRPKSRSNRSPSRAPELVLRKELIWDQEQKIVDLGFLDPPGAAQQRMIVLEPARIAVYEQGEAQWRLRQDFPVSAAKPWPRDLRGKFYRQKSDVPEAEAIGVSLPGGFCLLVLQGLSSASAIHCEQSDNSAAENQRLWWFSLAGPAMVEAGGDFASARNFFNGRLYGMSGWRATVEPFFSSASIRSVPPLTVNANVDGSVRVYEDFQKPPMLTFSGWGSGLTSLETKCASGWQVLATRSGDWSEPDAIQAYEIGESEAIALGQPLSFPGPVLAIGPAAIPQFGDTKNLNHNAFAVVRNLETGRYEAYQLSVSCER